MNNWDLTPIYDPNLQFTSIHHPLRIHPHIGVHIVGHGGALHITGLQAQLGHRQAIHLAKKQSVLPRNGLFK